MFYNGVWACLVPKRYNIDSQSIHVKLQKTSSREPPYIFPSSFNFKQLTASPLMPGNPGKPGGP